MKIKLPYIIAMGAFCMLVSCKSREKVQADYDVIPRPNSIVLEQGSPFVLDAETRIVYPQGNRALQETAELLADYILEATGHSLDVGVSLSLESGKHIILALNEDWAKTERYRLNIKRKVIRIESATEAGIFYGVQTLRKAMPIATPESVIELNPGVIDDEPRFAYRGMHLDVGRHLFPVEFIKKYIDILALHNVNYFHWHLTEDQGWRVQIRKYPQLTRVGSMRKETVVRQKSGEYDGELYGGYYTQDEVREIVEYAQSRFITIIPEIDLPGHTLAALASYPQFGCTGGPYEVGTHWGVFDDVICAGNEEAMQFLEDVLTEVMELFPSEFIHVGGDQCMKKRWEKCPKCQARIKSEKLAVNNGHSPEENLQSYVIRRMERHLNNNGRRMIGWDDVLQGGLAPNAMVMSWQGEEGGITAAQMGHSVIMTPLPYLYFNYLQSNDGRGPMGGFGPLDVERVYGYEPIPAELTPDQRELVVGCQANVWTEYMPTTSQVEYMILPRIAALSEVQWTRPENKNYEEFLQRMPRLLRIYQQRGYNYAKYIEALLPTQSENK